MRSFVRHWWLMGLGVILIAVGIGSWVSSSLETQRVLVEAHALAEALAVTPTSRVADVGAGDGDFTVALAGHHVTDGYVFATEVAVDRLGTIREAVTDAGLDNVTIVEGRDETTGLPPACCDAVFLRRVYHHLTTPDAIAADLYRAVRPGGRLAIVDFASTGILPWIAPVAGVPENRGGHGVPPDVVVHELTAAGFVLLDEYDNWPGGGFCLVFTKHERS